MLTSHSAKLLVSAPWLVRRRLRDAADLESFPKLGEADLVTLDVFDTALVRAVAHHDDVFALAAWRAVTRHGLDSSVAGLAQARRTAHRRALETASAAGRSETTIEAIYAHHEIADLALRAALLAEELATERDLCRADPAILAVYETLAARGMRVAFLSDTPFSTDFVRELLVGAGYAGDLEIYVSSAFGTTKADGGLYPAVAAAAGCSRIWHIGDNVRSDVIAARRSGVQGLWYRPRLRKSHPAPAPATAAGLAASVLAGTRAVAAGLDTREKIGATIAGPIYLAFVQWLIARLREAPVERVFFLARDAYPLKAFYERLRDPARDPPWTYLVVSRRSLVFPLIERLGDDELDVLLSHERPLPVADFLTRIGLEAAPHAAAALSHGLNLDHFVAGPADIAMLRAFVVSLEPAIVERAHEERGLLLRYLAQDGFVPDKALALCDVGWNGKSQRALAGLLGVGGRLDGYYVGTSDAVRRLGGTGGTARGWLVDDGRARFGVDVSTLSWVLMELLFSAPQPSVIRYREVEGRIEPVFREQVADAGFQEAVAQVQAGALLFLDAYVRAFGGLPVPAIDEVAAARALGRLVAAPTLAEAEALGDVVMIEGLGDTTTGYAIAAPPSWRNLTALARAYRNALWRRGFAVRVLRNAALAGALYGALERLRAARAGLRRPPITRASKSSVPAKAA